MKSGRRNLEHANSPKDLVDQFRELQKLRIKVSKAELAAAQEKSPGVNTQTDGSSRGKTVNRDRNH
jgi:hypothetical protein